MNTVSENMEDFKSTIYLVYPSGIMRFLVLVSTLIILRAPEYMTDDIDYRGHGLLTVPHISPCDYTAVNFVDNSVTSLTTPILTECHSLQRFTIGSNSITTVTKEAFTTIKDTLQLLGFQNNNLQSVGDEFSELTSLTYLNLNDNNLIGGIQEDAFCNTQMQKLHLKKCGLIQFPRVHIKCLNETLNKLFLNENSITELHAEDVEGLVNLVTFDLTDNLFTHIDASSFSTMTSLEWLIVNQTTYDKTTLADLEDDLSEREYNSVFVCSCQHIWLAQNNTIVSNAGQGFIPVHTYPCKDGEASTPRAVDVPRNEMLTCHSITVSANSKVRCARECQRNDDRVCTAFTYDKTTAVCEVWRTLNGTPDTDDMRNMHCIATNGKMECCSGA